VKKSTWVIFSILVLVSVIVLWFTGKNPEQANTVSVGVSQTLPTSAPVKLTKPVTSIKKKAVIKVEPEDEFNPYENEVLKAQLQQVSDIYAENIKYPITSQPIYNPEDAREYKEFEQSEVDLPFPEGDDDENPIRISAATNTFQYFEGDTVAVRVQISGAPQDTFIQVNGVLSGANGDLPIQGVFEPSDQSLSEFSAAFDTKLAPANLLTPEMLVKLNVTVGDRPLFTTVAFRYAVASAQIVAVQQVRPEGPNLVIPLQLNVFQSGYFFVNGVLEDARTGRPLLQLQAEKRLVQGNALVDLTAHISALRRQSSEGPYVLRSLRTYRGAEVGENFDAPASSSQARFNIQGFPFTAYDDQEFVDQQGQERLEFLRGLGAVDEDAARDAQQQLEQEAQDDTL